ncbi:cilia- and flagella-associated protein 91-like [Daktulosphaira vitifoliae]|uniref:cilia- and flagella-associated protein 91-like n=1 Tax=Daktulosphaira vitifoliae TaxID=58002 RepID=UPI0021AAA47A|nr:cilia- and flagella-associated protein 91-like [Daktulosphaira vitifoliae]
MEKSKKNILKECEDYEIAVDLTNIKFYEKSRLQKLNDNYQIRKTKIEMCVKNKLNKKYTEVEKKLKKDLRNLAWQKIRCKNIIPKLNKFPTHNYSLKQPKFIDKLISRKYNPSNTLQNPHDGFLKLKPYGQNIFKCIHCTLEGSSRCHGSHRRKENVCFNKMKVIQEELKAIRLNEDKKHLNISKKIEYDSNEVSNGLVKFSVESKFTELDHHINVFQKLIRGRAYHAMMFMARHKFDEMLKTVLNLETPDRPIKTKEYKKREIINDGKLGFTSKLINHFIMSLSNETFRINEEKKNKMLMKHAERVRCMVEAAEKKRRQIEEKIRLEHDEMYKQMVKIRQETAELAFDRFVENAIERSVEEQSVRYVKKVVSKTIPHNDNFYDPNRKELESELIFNFIVPEACRALVRKNIKEKQMKYLEVARSIICHESSNEEYN